LLRSRQLFFKSAGVKIEKNKFANYNCSPKDKLFDFHGTKFTIQVLSSETDYKYTVDIFHPPNLGPALHTPPKGSETFA
jgi:hypothetical protein